MGLVAALILALFGGAISWLGGRRILRYIEDPLFIERFFAHRMAMAQIYALIFVLIGFLARGASLWLAVLFCTSIAIGGFPARKKIFNESWTLSEYLGNRVRIWSFAGGLWIALALAPEILHGLGLQWWPVLFSILLIWFFLYDRLLVYGFDSEPLSDTTLLARLQPSLAKAEARAPKIYVGGPSTGRFANAFTLPRSRPQKILFTRVLLRELDVEESAAIFAHELAHAEEYSKRGMRVRITLGTVLIPALAVLPQAICLANAPQYAAVISLVWPIVFLGGVMFAQIARQNHETHADLRALELGAEPKALIRALEKIHLLNHLPRRIDANQEKHLTHPSLARRVRAIERRAGLETSTPELSLPRIIVSRNRRQFVRFSEEGIQVLRVARPETALDDAAFAATRLDRYESFRSLIVRHTLTGVELFGRGRRSLRVPLESATAAGLADLLTWAEQRLTTSEVEKPRIAARARLLAVILFLVSLIPGIPFPPLIGSILVLVSPTASALAAFGATAIGASVMALVRPVSPWLADLILASAALVAVLGLLGLVLLARIPREDRGRHFRLVTSIFAVLAAFVALAGMATTGAGDLLWDVVLLARSRPSLPVLLFGLAAALMVAGRRRLGGASVLVAVVVAILGTRPVAAALLDDPLVTKNRLLWVPALPTSQAELDWKTGDEATSSPVFHRIYAMPMNLAHLKRLPWIRLLGRDSGSRIMRASGTSTKMVARTILSPVFATPIPEDRRWLVIGQEPDSSYLAIFDSATGSIEAVGRLPEAARLMSVRGTRILLRNEPGDALLVVNLRTAKAMRFGCEGCYVIEGGLGDNAAGGQFYLGERFRVDTYSTEALE